MRVVFAGLGVVLAFGFVSGCVSLTHGSVVERSPRLLRIQKSSRPLPESKFIHASGAKIVDGTGHAIQLTGVNLGSWLVMEPWMCPFDSSGTVPDESTAITLLDKRFGVPTEQSLVSKFQNAWITDSDFNNVAAARLNCVRIPIWWGDFYTVDGKLRKDGFDQLDWAVAMAQLRHLYVIVDMHGVFGGQSNDFVTGMQNSNQYWKSSEDQLKTNLLWSMIAKHYYNNPVVAAYDLMNEPQGAPDQISVWEAYDRLYKAVRSVDHNHLIMMEPNWRGIGTDGKWLNWDWNVLPAPSEYHWTNVAYSPHSYPGSSQGVASETAKQIDQFNKYSIASGWNVPVIIGEFNEGSSSSDWSSTIAAWNRAGISWIFWTYKTTTGTGASHWGLYTANGTDGPPGYGGSPDLGKPNLESDSANQIAQNWESWTTNREFHKNSLVSDPIDAADHQ